MNAYAGTELVRRATIDDLVNRRNLAISLYGEAYETLKKARAIADLAAPSEHDASYMTDEARNRFAPNYGLNDRDDKAEFIGIMIKQLDRAVWRHLIKSTSLDRLMDKTARDAFEKQLRDNPPVATAETCFATMESLLSDAGMIFKRGIAVAFSKLDRRFRSHDGFKIGSRVVLSRAMSQHGGWNYGWGQDDTLRDVERTFCILDSKPHPERSAGIIGAIDLALKDLGYGARAFTAENEYFDVRIFQNGNAHIWFKRRDLVERVNKLLAEFYGDALGDAHAKPEHAPNRSLAKNLGWFETPARVADEAIGRARIFQDATILEPSAGLGSLAGRARDSGGVVTCVELHPERACALRALGMRVIEGDFLDLSNFQLFDRVVMNPPFDRGRDVDHVTHALRFLKACGRLVAVMAAGVEYRSDRKTVDFRARIEAMGGRFFDLPIGAFAESGTNVNTCLLVVPQ